MRKERLREEGRENGESRRKDERGGKRRGQRRGQDDGENIVARVYRELWLSPASIPPSPKELHVSTEEELPQRGKSARGRLRREEPEVRERGTTTGRGQELTWKRM